MNLSIWILVGAMSISSFFSFWNLHYFCKLNCLKNSLSNMISCSSSIKLITSDFFFVILESDIDSEYIYWALTPLQLEKFQLKFSQYVCYIIWKSHCTKIILARLLKLTVWYICIDELAWHPNTEPKCFKNKVCKKIT